MICPKCGREFDTVPDAAQFCPDCFRRAVESLQKEQFELNSSSMDSNRYCPWEDEQRLNFTQGLLQTLRQSLFEPTFFFRRLPLNAGYKFPFLYALVVSSIAILATYLASAIIDHKAAQWHHEMLFAGARFGGLIYVLLVISVEIFIKPVVLLMCLLVLGVRNASLEAVFRISCYSMGPGIFNVIPILGALVAGVWEFVILAIGLKEGFSIGIARAILAILLPVIFSAAFLIVLIMLVIGKLF
ncbi:MAG: YIP1 family protein [Desulfomonilaceae bacterium]